MTKLKTQTSKHTDTHLHKPMQAHTQTGTETIQVKYYNVD